MPNGVGFGKNYRNIFCDDLTVIWLGQVVCRIGIGHIFGDVPHCTAAEKDGENEDGETHLPWPKCVLGQCTPPSRQFDDIGGGPKDRAHSRPGLSVARLLEKRIGGHPGVEIILWTVAGCHQNYAP